MDGAVAAMFLRNLLILSVISLLAACGEQKLPSPFKASDISAKYARADFHLSDAAGKPVSLADFRGKVVVMFFGYTHCPQVCPTTLADLAQVMRMLDKDADKVQVLFVTLDPERDTRELLAQYPPAFYPTFKGLSGDTMATAQAAQAFGVIYQKQPSKNGGYDLDHSAGTYLIAPGGSPVLLAPYGQRAEFMIQDIRLLLALQPKNRS
jgi:protein SCO1/2